MKSSAALRGVSLKRYVTEAIEQVLATEQAENEAPNSGKRAEMPLIPGKHPPLELTNAEIEELLT